jgi:thiol-disulfide isomerase/thioredoxin
MNSSKKHFLFTLILFICLSGYSQQIPVLNFEKLQPLLNKQNDTLYLVNFWATWCVPCVKEMPAIQKITAKYSEAKFKVLLVSFDFPSQIESRLKPFLKNHNISSDVVVLDDADFNSWIDKVEINWSGSIPATLIYDAHSRDFYEQSFEFEELDNMIQSKIR